MYYFPTLCDVLYFYPMWCTVFLPYVMYYISTLCDVLYFYPVWCTIFLPCVMYCIFILCDVLYFYPMWCTIFLPCVMYYISTLCDVLYFCHQDISMFWTSSTGIVQWVSSILVGLTWPPTLLVTWPGSRWSMAHSSLTSVSSNSSTRDR